MGSSENAGTATAAGPSATAARASTLTGAAEGSSYQGFAESENRESAPRSPTAERSESLEKISISCLMNAHYHAGREAFLDTVHRWFMFAVIFLGASALADLFPADHKAVLAALCSAGAAIIAALDLTFDLSNRAREHNMMRRRYFELLADLREGKVTPEAARVCLERYSGDEEPPYRVLLLTCWNLAQAAVYGDDAHNYVIRYRARAIKNFLRRPGAEFPVRKGSATES